MSITYHKGKSSIVIFKDKHHVRVAKNIVNKLSGAKLTTYKDITSVEELSHLHNTAMRYGYWISAKDRALITHNPKYIFSSQFK